MRKPFTTWYPIIIAMLLCGQSVAQAQLSDERIEQAISDIKGFWYKEQRVSHWEHISGLSKSYPGGLTALATHALLVGGESPKDPRVARALGYLQQADINRTYSISVRAQVASMLESPVWDRQLRDDFAWLRKAASKRGTHGYKLQPTSNRIDHSTTHYATLAFRAAARRKIQVSATYWTALTKHLITHQLNDGGWNYDGNSSKQSKLSMTAACLTMLYIAKQQGQKSILIDKAIDRGLKWMDQGYSNDGDKYGYGWAAIQRLGNLSGRTRFRNRDWFDEGAQWFIKRQEGNGRISGGDRMNVKTAFGLIFLSKGRGAFACNKLIGPNNEWNDWDFDIYNLTHQVGTTRLSPAKWQAVTFKSPDEQWNKAPVLYWSSAHPHLLNKDMHAKLKRYLDQGGMLIANPVRGSPRFKTWIADLVNKLYPDHPMRTLPDDHLFFEAHHKIKGGSKLQVQSVAVENLEKIVLLPRGWGIALENGRTTSREHQLIENMVIAMMVFAQQPDQ